MKGNRRRVNVTVDIKRQPVVLHEDHTVRRHRYLGALVGVVLALIGVTIYLMLRLFGVCCGPAILSTAQHANAVQVAAAKGESTTDDTCNPAVNTLTVDGPERADGQCVPAPDAGGPPPAVSAGDIATIIGVILLLFVAAFMAYYLFVRHGHEPTPVHVHVQSVVAPPAPVHVYAPPVKVDLHTGPTTVQILEKDVELAKKNLEKAEERIETALKSAPKESETISKLEQNVERTKHKVAEAEEAVQRELPALGKQISKRAVNDLPGQTGMKNQVEVAKAKLGLLENR